jgi:hypothetical protein
MRDFKREFSSSKDSCERKEINDESRKKSQVDVFIAVILFFRIIFLLNHLAIFVVLAFVALVFVAFIFDVVTFSLKTRM